MKIALTIWNGRIAPVFDVAKVAWVIESQDQQKIRETRMTLPESSPAAKIIQLKAQNVEVLICGAISRETMLTAQSQGLKIYAFLAGEAREILTAWQENRLTNGHFAMPGCSRRHCCCRRRQHGPHFNF